MAAVKTVSLTKEYSNGEHYLRAVDDISFTVEEERTGRAYCLGFQ